MDLLERSSLLEELSGVLAAPAGGRVVLLAGEAGIGKSALVKRRLERTPVMLIVTWEERGWTSPPSAPGYSHRRTAVRSHRPTRRRTRPGCLRRRHAGAPDGPSASRHPQARDAVVAMDRS
jgi:hypothetical protein